MLGVALGLILILAFTFQASHRRFAKRGQGTKTKPLITDDTKGAVTSARAHDRKNDADALPDAAASHAGKNTAVLCVLPQPWDAGQIERATIYIVGAGGKIERRLPVAGPEACGGWHVLDLDIGDKYVYVEPERGRGYAVGWTAVSLTGLQQKTVASIFLPQATNITGRVCDERGQPITTGIKIVAEVLLVTPSWGKEDSYRINSDKLGVVSYFSPGRLRHYELVDSWGRFRFSSLPAACAAIRVLGFDENVLAEVSAAPGEYITLIVKGMR